MNNRLNYLYWRKEGNSWPNEYKQRKKDIIQYDLQEAMIAQYFEHSKPAKILEFGCGFGRHLEYLSKIEGIEAFGADQSRTMMNGLHQWASKEWIVEHTAQINPVGPLPYADKSFDIVLTAEVLVHVHPDDLINILSEIIRVSNWQILHLETASDYKLDPMAHGGCWYHNLYDAYKTLGYQCIELPKGYAAHTPYRVILDQNRNLFSWGNMFLNKIYDTEKIIQETIDRYKLKLMDNEKTIENIGNQLNDEKKKTLEQSKTILDYQNNIREKERIIINLQNNLQKLEADINLSRKFEEQLLNILKGN